MRPVITDADSGRILWRVADCAHFCGISQATWRSYVRYGIPPESVGSLGRQALWFADEVEAWHAQRRGQGWRGAH